MTTAPGQGPVEGCLFCRIVHGEVPATVVYEGERVLTFRDIAPVAPIHILLVPREHLSDAAAIEADHGEVLAELLVGARVLAESEGIAARGYRLVFNVGDDAGNTVSHLHLHLLGGRVMGWPPG